MRGGDDSPLRQKEAGERGSLKTEGRGIQRWTQVLEDVAAEGPSTRGARCFPHMWDHREYFYSLCCK